MNYDLDRFWAADAVAHEENCFTPKATQMALGIRMSDECVFAELGEEGEPWGQTPRERRIELNKRYNDIAEKTVGMRLLSEELPHEDAAFPQVKRIGDIMGGEYVFDGHTEWLQRRLYSEEELEARVAWVETVTEDELRAFMLPANWEAEKRRIYETYGLKPQPSHDIRGPVTLACSVYGETELIYLLYDNPELASRFSAAITRAIIMRNEILDAEAGYGRYDVRGFSFSDDDCCLLSPELYETFGYPILRDVFARFSPDAGDWRYQHSDSAMGHLLPILGRLNLTACNFGPTVMIDEIRRYMPRTRVDGAIAPFTFMRNDREGIVAAVKRDAKFARELGRGVNFSTAGSINNGSKLSSMRLIMDAIMEYGRF